MCLHVLPKGSRLWKYRRKVCRRLLCHVNTLTHGGARGGYNLLWQLDVLVGGRWGRHRVRWKSARWSCLWGDSDTRGVCLSQGSDTEGAAYSKKTSSSGAIAADFAGVGESYANFIFRLSPRGGGGGSAATRTIDASHPAADGMVARIAAPTGTSTSTHMQFGSPDCNPLHTIFLKVPTFRNIASRCFQHTFQGSKIPIMFSRFIICFFLWANDSKILIMWSQ